jgi:hypothetical protein
VLNPNTGLSFKQQGLPVAFEPIGSYQFSISEGSIVTYSEWFDVRLTDQLIVIPAPYANEASASISFHVETGNTISFRTIRRLSRLDRPEEQEIVVG